MKKVLKWIGIVLGSLIGLALVAVLVLIMMGNAHFNKTYEFPPSNLTIPTDAESIAAGQHLAQTLCETCHGPDLSGINNWFNGGALGTIDSANLTSVKEGWGRILQTKILCEPFATVLTRKANPLLCLPLFPRLT